MEVSFGCVKHRGIRCPSHKLTWRETMAKGFAFFFPPLPFVFWILLQASQVDTFAERDKKQPERGEAQPLESQCDCL